MKRPTAGTALGGERGMTLAETLVAAAVLAIGLVAVVAVVPVASHAIQEGNQLSTAVFLANQRLEQVRSARWEGGAAPVDEVGVSDPAHAAPAASGVTTFPDEAPMAPPFVDYARRVRIVDCEAGCGGLVSPAMRQVVVEVDYRPLTATGVAAPAQRRSAVLSLYLSRR
jgi:hypothetical protein